MRIRIRIFFPALQADLAEIRANAANFRSYTAQGDTHCILPLDRFYQQETAGVRFRDWVDGLARGEDAPEVKGGRD